MNLPPRSTDVQSAPMIQLEHHTTHSAPMQPSGSGSSASASVLPTGAGTNVIGIEPDGAPSGQTPQESGSRQDSLVRTGSTLSRATSSGSNCESVNDENQNVE